MEIKDEERLATIPLIAHELAMARLERIIRALVIVIVLLVGVIAYDAYQDAQYDYSDIVIDTQDGGNANYLNAGTSGVINDAKNSGAKAHPEEKK